ncbi:MAG: hypothetical protein COB93_02405 [Sneathiella sp.]|nr:MAG: hypothetical protein COB93_02405 [Sneathiella sp.]
MPLPDHLNEINGQRSNVGQLPNGLISAPEHTLLINFDFKRLCRIFEALCNCPDGNTTTDWVIGDAIRSAHKVDGIARAHSITNASINRSSAAYMKILRRWKDELSDLSEVA